MPHNRLNYQPLWLSPGRNFYVKTLALIPAVALLSALAAGGANALSAESPTTLGWIERVAIADTPLVMHAKIDTGADHSSINASDITYTSHHGQAWVRFSIHDRNGVKTAIERPLLRVGQIKRKEGGHIERPVVMMDLCVAGQQVKAEVNLANREHFKYQLLVGRSLMARRFVVDPERTYITQPACAAS